MCAIFGFIARNDSAVNVSTLAAIVKGNICRGGHAFGLSWIDADGRLHCYKQSGRLTDHLPVLRLATGSRVLIGHLRYATHGDVSDNINNHPHASDGGWIVHNGVIGNYRQLVREQNLPIVTRCDSEVLGLMIEQGSGRLITRCAESIAQAEGNLCMMGLWARPANLIVARRGNPLHLSDTTAGVYFASLADGLPGKPAAIRDDTIRLYTRKNGAIHHRIIDLAPPEPGPEWDDLSADADDSDDSLFDPPPAKPRSGVTRIAGKWLNSRGQVCGD